MPVLRTLIVQHVPDSNPPAFVVARHDPPQTTPEAAPITPPERFGAEQLPDTDLRRELRWYLERFLEYPFLPNTDRADRTLGILEAWGTHAFDALFHGGPARDWYRDIVRDGTENLQLRIVANEPAVLAWPWEGLHDPERGYLAHECHIERQLNNVADPPPLHPDTPRDRLNILLVTARPFEADVEYRSISRALVEQIEAHRLAACVTVLRPPTFDALREELARRPGYYHILHFDGHGGYGIIADDPAQAGTLAEAVNRHAFQAPQGCLVFETADGKPHPVPAQTLSATLREFRIPMVVLNACQSGTIDENAENAFASVAASLVRAGIRSVVAMAWSLYVSGAQQFLPAFYKRLLQTGSLAEPTRAGRIAMLTHSGRVCARGTHPLHDWLVPVVYQQQPADLSFVTQVRPAGDDKQESTLPKEAMDEENPYGFIGRDNAILALERALLRDAPAILVHGLGGVGKTTLARGFVQWLRQTDGLGVGCLWFMFNDIHNVEYVLHGIGTQIFGPNFITLDTNQKLATLGKALRENRLLLVWDNFESASGNEAAGIDPLLRPDDLQLLRRFLQAIRGGKSKVVITSRSEESSWLPNDLRYKLPLGGLAGESRWEFCTAILRNLGIQTDRSDPELAGLMDALDGHPLLMRAVLPRLESGRSPKSILDELQGNLRQGASGSDPTQQKVYATLRFVQDGLPPDLRPLLLPLALHDRFVDADYVEAMAKSATLAQATRARIDCLLSALATAGLVRDRGQAIYELHPALTGFLRSTVLADADAGERESWQRGFVDVMGRLADALAPKELHEQRLPFHVHSANFRAALALAESLDMDAGVAALTQALAAYAQNTLDFDSAQRLFERFAENRRLAGDSKAEAGGYHQLGRVAEERRDFATAEQWYLKSLAIKEKLGDEHGAARTYHHLGKVAQERRDFAAAEQWYRKSLAIKEKQDEQGAAITYGQLGRLAQERRDFQKAGEWYLKALQIFKKQGKEHDAAKAHGQLGRVALESGDFARANDEYLKAVQFFERVDDEANASIGYHQLGRIAEEHRDFATAEQWYLKSLAIEEKQSNEHGAATSYGQLGVIAGLQERFVESGKWFIKSVRTFRKCHDAQAAEEGAWNFVVSLRRAPEADKARMLKLWQEAGLGDLPEIKGGDAHD